MSLMIDGIATFTIVESTMIKATPRLMKTTPAHRLLSMLSNITAQTVRLRIVNVPDTEDWSLGRLLSTAARMIDVYDDKWGPAVAIRLRTDAPSFAFMGWAST